MTFLTREIPAPEVTSIWCNFPLWFHFITGQTVTPSGICRKRFHDKSMWTAITQLCTLIGDTFIYSKWHGFKCPRMLENPSSEAHDDVWRSRVRLVNAFYGIASTVALWKSQFDRELVRSWKDAFRHCSVKIRNKDIKSRARWHHMTRVIWWQFAPHTLRSCDGIILVMSF